MGQRLQEWRASRGSDFTISDTHSPALGRGAGLGLPILGKLLGHSQAATTQRYAHLASDPMHQAVNTIGDAIEAAMKGADRKVVPLRKIAPDRG